MSKDNLVPELILEVKLLRESVAELSKIVTSLARIEVRAEHLEKSVDGFGARMAKYEDKTNLRIKELEIRAAVQATTGSATSRLVERIVMFIVMAALASYGFFKN